MADRPIIFSAPMIRALLAGRKTQTRRVLKPQPFVNGFHFDGRDILCHCDELPPATLMRRMGRGRHAYTGSILEDGPEGLTGFYIGDRLWVREAHALVGANAIVRAGHAEERSAGPRVDVRWRPSIHMPRWASRLTLDVTAVKVERLQDISEADALAESVERLAYPERGDWGWPQRRFKELWNSLHGPDAWSANPWVAAITFAVTQANIDALPPERSAA